MRTYRNDEELWTDFLSGDNHAFELIYKRNVDDLFSYGYKLSGDRELTKDCIQDLFIKIHRNRKTLGVTDNIPFYLMRALRNKIVSHYGRFNMVSIESTEAAFFEIENIPSPEDEEMYSPEQKKTLTQAISRLTPRQREAVYLRYMKELSIEEVGSLLDMNSQSVRNLLHRSLLKLRRELALLILLLNL